VCLSIYGGSDYAVTADGGDYTVHLVVGIDPEGRMYLLDRWRKQSSSDEWIEAFCDLVLEWKPVGWAEEKGQISVGVGPALDKRQRERGRRVLLSAAVADCQHYATATCAHLSDNLHHSII
jgi:hypothetical protein